MQIVAFSDIHGRIVEYLDSYRDMLQGDLLIFAGDVGGHTTLSELRHFCETLKDVDCKQKILIPGNHDSCFSQEPAATNTLLFDYGWAYLTHGLYHLNIGGKLITVIGSAYTLPFLNWYFMKSEDELKAVWVIDSLTFSGQEHFKLCVTHGPPFGIMDKVFHPVEKFTGSSSLREAIFRLKPDYHIFGHIHEHYGCINLEGINFCNVSSLCHFYENFRPPVVINF